MNEAILLVKTLGIWLQKNCLKKSRLKLTYPVLSDHRVKMIWAYCVVVGMFDVHRSDRGSNPGRGGKIS